MLEWSVGTLTLWGMGWIVWWVAHSIHVGPYWKTMIPNRNQRIHLSNTIAYVTIILLVLGVFTALPVIFN
jgi:hypothetical protein